MTPSLQPALQVAASLRVLIVDDDREAADVLSLCLQLMGCRTHVAYDGNNGIAEAMRFEPEVAIWDIALPGVDGYEAARRLRRTQDGQRISLIALTGLPAGEHAMTALAAGFDHHLKKPVDVEQLLRILSTLS